MFKRKANYSAPEVEATEAAPEGVICASPDDGFTETPSIPVGDDDEQLF